MTQEEWIESCLVKYRLEQLPEEEHWEEAHYPIPKCDGGTRVIRLWSRDHSVHGVVQSEELQRPCIHGYRVHWDRNLLSLYYPEWLGLYEKWYKEHKSRAGKIGGTRVPKEAKSRGGKNCPKEAKSRGGKNQPRDVKSEAGKKGGSRTPPEVRSASGRKATAQRWQCTITGFVTNAASLSRYQMKRGIDTSNRIRLS
jgi:hypothetical protein